MSVFDEPSSPDEAPRAWAESVAEYLHRSSMATAVETRAWLRDRLSHAPTPSLVDLERRLASRDDRQHYGACWELGLVSALHEHGCTIEAHPELPGTTRRPDWRVTLSSGLRFYLEATTAAWSDEEQSARMRRGQLYDALNKVKSDDHMLAVCVDGEGSTTPAGRSWRARTEQMISNWNYDEVSSAREDALPEARIEDAGWSATLRPLPLRSDARGASGRRAVGVIGPEALTDPIPAARAALESKASAYGQLDAPFLVALNVLAPMVDDMVVAAVLFGSPALAISRDGSKPDRPFRQPDGFWWKGKPTNGRVEAVLIGRQFAKASHALDAITGWPNPYLSQRFALTALPFQHLIVDDAGQLSRP